jgi:hypothetical protein
MRYWALDVFRVTHLLQVSESGAGHSWRQEDILGLLGGGSFLPSVGA